ncbi:ATP-grasp peptide maturase system methyltransferase [Streptomyces sp. SID13031]|uniref:ATP-grasp peptide maturase system methyltransferase n=1 Tax=Streptomyces sp. SID13031 TaxID=2706046 RepID=UPI0013CAEC53|nr:ATP-grasp peptide maturase system methyltransferase [Streptomyces sp. SID13031]NEA35137.1 methyltransferase [Streptomyces sp. SID13031]
MTTPEPDGGRAAALRVKLADELEASGDLRTEPWRATIETVPREAFIPSFFERIDTPQQTMWRPITPELVSQQARLELTYTDETWVTQLDHHTWPVDTAVPIPGEPTSSSTLPGLVVRMLEELQVEDGSRVLEIGTGTGYSSALMSARLGAELVTSVEVDAEVAVRAKEALAAIGFMPDLVTGDGLLGYQPGALYDRVIATCSVRHVPKTWVNQTRPGGLILTTMLGWLDASSGLVRLEVTGDGTAEGAFLGGTESFMPARPHAAPRLGDDVYTWIDEVETTERATAAGPEILDPWDGWTSMFIAQLAVPDSQLLIYGVDGGPVIEHIIDVNQHAIAILRKLPDDSTVVRQAGPVALWDSVEAAISEWRNAGSPPLEQFRISVTPEAQTVWFGDPVGPLSWKLPTNTQ